MSAINCKNPNLIGDFTQPHPSRPVTTDEPLSRWTELGPQWKLKNPNLTDGAPYEFPQDFTRGFFRVVSRGPDPLTGEHLHQVVENSTGVGDLKRGDWVKYIGVDAHVGNGARYMYDMRFPGVEPALRLCAGDFILAGPTTQSL
ncbi:MAG: hypothetical protein AAF658_04310 [Myxococcota bacterium]